MNTHKAGSTPAASRTPSEIDRQQAHHARQESGYQSSTIGTNSLPPMTIGVKRGSDLLASRRGPQIIGNATSTSTPTNAGTRAGSAPPHSSTAGAYNNHIHNQSTGNLSIQEIFDYREFQQRAHEFDNAIAMGKHPSVRPVYVSQLGGDDQNHDEEEGSIVDEDDYGHDEDNDNDDQEGTEDDGIEPAEGYHEEEQESQVDIYRRLPEEADPASSAVRNNKKMHAQQQQQQQPFYQLQGDNNDEEDEDYGNRSPLSAGSEPRGQLLSSEALAGESSANFHLPCFSPALFKKPSGT